mmetsp:Transcript_31988/g.48242  ORF Transcript_31988/g.48242 Transcript_31988/m.48242 type:complete len:117 (+) Transcript_31988:273-623(+)
MRESKKNRFSNSRGCNSREKQKEEKEAHIMYTPIFQGWCSHLINPTIDCRNNPLSKIVVDSIRSCYSLPAGGGSYLSTAIFKKELQMCRRRKQRMDVITKRLRSSDTQSKLCCINR